MIVKYPVNGEIIDWAIGQSGLEPELVEARLPYLADWLEELTDKSDGLSVAKISKISKALNIPFGYFFMDRPPAKSDPLISYRTIANERYEQMSRGLAESVADMKRKQYFVREIRKELQNPLEFVGRFHVESSYLDIANDIRKELDLSLDWNSRVNGRINYIRSILESSGILIFRNGVALANNKRRLNLEEFRAFVLIDEYAPLIFVNTQDTQSAQLFSICHELAHIWLGQEEILNNFSRDNHFDFEEQRINNLELERLANRVAAELLLPESKIDLVFDEFSLENIYSVASRLGVSPQVVAIRLYEEHKIEKETYSEYREIILERTQVILDQIQDESSSGGNYYNTYFSKIDHSFFHLVNTQVESGNITYTDAYSLLNVKKGKTYTSLINRFYGEK